MFSMMIVMFHARKLVDNGEKALFLYGAIGVEFFFLTSGYLMAKKALSKKENCSNIGEETYIYIWKKIKAFFPYMLVAFAISLFVKNWINPIPKSKIINSIYSLFFIEMGGIKLISIVPQTWYISAMLISMMILYPIIRKYKKNFTYLIAPIIVIIIGGWISQTYGNLRGTLVWTGIFYTGLLRAFFELALGAILYEVSEKIKNINFTKLGEWILTIIEILGFVSIFIITNIKNASTKYDFVMLAILTVSIAIAFSEKTIFIKLSKNKFCYYLEKLSLPIYLNHGWIIEIIKRVLGYLSYMQKLGIVIVVTLIFSMIIMYLIEKIKGKPTKIARKIFIIKQ